MPEGVEGLLSSESPLFKGISVIKQIDVSKPQTDPILEHISPSESPTPQGLADFLDYFPDVHYRLGKSKLGTSSGGDGIYEFNGRKYYFHSFEMQLRGGESELGRLTHDRAVSEVHGHPNTTRSHFIVSLQDGSRLDYSDVDIRRLRLGEDTINPDELGYLYGSKKRVNDPVENLISNPDEEVKISSVDEYKRLIDLKIALRNIGIEDPQIKYVIDRSDLRMIFSAIALSEEPSRVVGSDPEPSDIDLRFQHHGEIGNFFMKIGQTDPALRDLFLSRIGKMKVTSGAQYEINRAERQIRTQDDPNVQANFERVKSHLEVVHE